MLVSDDHALFGLQALAAGAAGSNALVPHQQPVMVPAFAVGPGGIPLGPNGMPSPMVLAEIAGVKRKRDPNKPRKPRQPAQADDSGRTCSTCGTSTTPKWRCGMTLCNACGLRTSKKVCAVHAAHVYHPDLILGPVIARHRQSKPPPLLLHSRRSKLPTGR